MIARPRKFHVRRLRPDSFPVTKFTALLPSHPLGPRQPAAPKEKF